LWHGEYAGAIELAITLIGNTLRRAGKRMPKQAEFPPPGAEADFIHSSGLQSLRDPGDRHSNRKSG
jgi:hypothetical protein